MKNHYNLFNESKIHLNKAIEHLEYSYNKVQSLPINYTNMNEEIMETWESFSARFARVADLFLMKYLRTKILMEDPGYKGTLRDSLNFSEKMAWISNAQEWLKIRELRNVAAHEYNDEDLTEYYKKLLEYCPILLKLKKII